MFHISFCKLNASLNFTKTPQIIGRAGTGTDNIDIPAASDAGVVVMNTPGGNTNSAAEHTCALILSMCRNIPNRHTELMNGQWNRINGLYFQLYYFLTRNSMILNALQPSNRAITKYLCVPGKCHVPKLLVLKELNLGAHYSIA